LIIFPVSNSVKRRLGEKEEKLILLR